MKARTGEKKEIKEWEKKNKERERGVELINSLY